jgi:hypothetical protein
MKLSTRELTHSGKSSGGRKGDTPAIRLGCGVCVDVSVDLFVGITVDVRVSVDLSVFV